MDRNKGNLGQFENSFPWYDAYWLKYFSAARELVAARFPSQLLDFERAFDGLRTSPEFSTIQIERFFDAEILDLCKKEIQKLNSTELAKHEFVKFGRLIKHDLPFFSELQCALTDKVSELAGEELEPSYNFLCLYNNLGICEVHLDSPHSKWTLDVCIERSAEWPIQVSQVVDWPESSLGLSRNWPKSVRENLDLSFSSFRQAPGDALFFSGSSQWHFRDRIPARVKQNFFHLIFFHYFPKGMRQLAWPEHWAEYFGIAELNEAVGTCGATSIFDFGEFRGALDKAGNKIG
jgi:hypothetical protein